VTRLGDFSPTLGNCFRFFWKLRNEPKIFAYIFLRKRWFMHYFWLKTGWAPLWAKLSRARLVTLLATYVIILLCVVDFSLASNMTIASDDPKRQKSKI
jgi:hypothetical protein